MDSITRTALIVIAVCMVFIVFHDLSAPARAQDIGCGLAMIEPCYIQLVKN
jgi:hypothetical protein